MRRLARHPHKKGVESGQRTYFHSCLKVNTIEQEYVLPSGQHNLSHRRGRSRVAARLQMEVIVADWQIPMWLSAVAFVVAVYLAYEGLQRA